MRTSLLEKAYSSASFVAHPAAQIATTLTKVTAAWSTAACSPAPGLGLGCSERLAWPAYCWRSRPRAHLLPSPARPVLSVEERRRVLDCLRELRFVDLTPAEIYATLLDEGTYGYSIPLGALVPGRNMYHILAEHGAVRERRNQLRHPVY